MEINFTNIDINEARDRDQWRTLMNVVMNLGVP